MLFGAVNFGLSTGLVAAAVGLEARKSPIAIWREHFVGLWVTYLGGTLASMLMLVLTHDWQGDPLQPLEVLLLIVPLPVILYVTFSHAIGRAQDQIEHLGGMNRVYVATIEALAQTIDAKDQVTHDHIRRVQENSVRLARALDVTDEAEIQALKAASLLHDVGKISVPEHILNKPGRLTPSELEIMRRHAPVGADILSVIGFPVPGCADRPSSSRKLGRHRVSRRPRGRGDPDWRTHSDGGRLLRRADVGSPVSPAI